MDTYDFESGISTTNTPSSYSDVSGVYVPPAPVTSTNVPASATPATSSVWDTVTKAFGALGSAANTSAGVYKTVTSANPATTTPSNIAKQTGALTEQQLAAQRATENKAANSTALSKYAPWLIGIIVIGLLGFFALGRKRK